MPPLSDPTASPAAAPPPVRRRFRARGQRPMVAVVGAGFSGTVAAIHLRRALPPDHVVSLFERSGSFARGPAYAASGFPRLLNVRTANMSALPDEPGHFEAWLARGGTRWADQVEVTAAGPFATRQAYGRYLRALLYEEMAGSGGQVRLHGAGVDSLRRSAGGWTLGLGNGREAEAAGVVLAIGNLPSQRPSDGVVFHNPWDPRATAELRPGEPVLIVGTGLTMVDLVLAMRAQGFEGPVVALSRRGLVPQRHGSPELPVPCPEFGNAERHSVLALTRAFRRHVADAARQGGTWRAAMDGLRPVTGALWQGLDVVERRRFLRHLRPFWDVHRHRLAPTAADAFEAAVASGCLRLKRGRVTCMEVRDGPTGPAARVAIRDRSADAAEPMLVQRVIHATGVGAGVAEDGLVAHLLSAGLARRDPLGLGLDVSDELRVLDADGARQPGLWALGPIVRGVFWECTAVPDIRVQARLIANALAQGLADPRASPG